MEDEVNTQNKEQKTEETESKRIDCTNCSILITNISQSVASVLPFFPVPLSCHLPGGKCLKSV